jgi:hypothetical protein
MRRLIAGATQKLAEAPCDVLGSEVAIDALQEAQLLDQVLRLVFPAWHVVRGLALLVH